MQTKKKQVNLSAVDIKDPNYVEDFDTITQAQEVIFYASKVDKNDNFIGVEKEIQIFTNILN
jgi:hypothetical protein